MLVNPCIRAYRSGPSLSPKVTIVLILRGLPGLKGTFFGDKSHLNARLNVLCFINKDKCLMFSVLVALSPKTKADLLKN